MARCFRCNKILFFTSSSGYCKACEKDIQDEERKRQEEEAWRRAEEARRKAEEERKRWEEETRRKAEEERRKAEEERKRWEEETRRKAEEERKRQEEIIAAFISFPLKGNVHFGDSIQNVIAKETRNVITAESDSTHLVFPDAVTSISGGKTYYSFAPDGSGLKGMSYTYHRVIRGDRMDSSSVFEKTEDTLLAGLKKKYGDPCFESSVAGLSLKWLNKGSEYYRVFSDADHYSGSTLWGSFGLFSRADAQQSRIYVRQLNDMNIHSEDIRVSVKVNKLLFGYTGWVIPVDGNYVVIQMVKNRRFDSPEIYVNGKKSDITLPFWFSDKEDYFVPAGQYGIDPEIHFMDVVYVRYSKNEFDRIMAAQRKTEELAAKKAAEKEQRFLDEL